MRCLIASPGLKPDIADIPNTLEGLQAAVGGYIEVVPLADNAAMIVNEEGKLLNLRHNRWVFDKYGRLRDIVRGVILVVGVDGENFCDLDIPQADFYMDVFRGKSVYL